MMIKKILFLCLSFFFIQNINLPHSLATPSLSDLLWEHSELGTAAGKRLEIENQILSHGKDQIISVFSDLIKTDYKEALRYGRDARMLSAMSKILKQIAPIPSELVIDILNIKYQSLNKSETKPYLETAQENILNAVRIDKNFEELEEIIESGRTSYSHAAQIKAVQLSIFANQTSQFARNIKALISAYSALESTTEEKEHILELIIGLYNQSPQKTFTVFQEILSEDIINKPIRIAFYARNLIAISRALVKMKPVPSSFILTVLKTRSDHLFRYDVDPPLKSAHSIILNAVDVENNKLELQEIIELARQSNSHRSQLKAVDLSIKSLSFENFERDISNLFSIYAELDSTTEDREKILELLKELHRMDNLYYFSTVSKILSQDTISRPISSSFYARKVSAIAYSLKLTQPIPQMIVEQIQNTDYDYLFRRDVEVYLTSAKESLDGLKITPHPSCSSLL